jgi:hypothetical protein
VIDLLILAFVLIAFLVALYARHRVMRDPQYRRPGYIHRHDDDNQ